MAAGLVVGVAFSSPLPHVHQTMLGALAGVVAAAGASGPSGIARRIALVAAVSERRLLDTLVGCGVALVATYLLWPRDTEEDGVPVPSSP